MNLLEAPFLPKLHPCRLIRRPQWEEGKYCGKRHGRAGLDHPATAICACLTAAATPAAGCPADTAYICHRTANTTSTTV